MGLPLALCFSRGRARPQLIVLVVVIVIDSPGWSWVAETLPSKHSDGLKATAQKGTEYEYENEDEDDSRARTI